MTTRFIHVVVLATSISLAFVSSTRSDPVSDPISFISSIYKKSDISPPDDFWLEDETRAKYFSKATAESWKKADAKVNPNGDEVDAIEFDPTTNSQDFKLKSFSIVSQHVADDKADVTVKLVATDEYVPRSDPKDDLIRYDLVRENGRWVIDDISSAVDGKPWTLKKLIAFQLAQ